MGRFPNRRGLRCRAWECRADTYATCRLEIPSLIGEGWAIKRNASRGEQRRRAVRWREIRRAHERPSQRQESAKGWRLTQHAWTADDQTGRGLRSAPPSTKEVASWVGLNSGDYGVSWWSRAGQPRTPQWFGALPAGATALAPNDLYRSEVCQVAPSRDRRSATKGGFELSQRATPDARAEAVTKEQARRANWRACSFSVENR